MLIPGLKNITQLSVGSNYALALDNKGNVFAWGNGQQDQLGRRLVERRRFQALLPTHVGLPKNKIVSIHAASNHAFAVDNKGNTWAWGLNNFAQTGIPDHAGEGGNTVTAPRKVDSLVGKNMKVVSGGSHHSIGVTDDGKVLVWGRIDGAQAGVDLKTLPMDDPTQVIVDRGKPRILLKPHQVDVPTGSYVAAGSDHNLAITTEGKAYSWGFNVNYQCGQGNNDDIEIATLIDNTAVREQKLTWAGAGGQYSMLASFYNEPQINGHHLTNGVHTPSN
jgi:regulator of chromosome condensation